MPLKPKKETALRNLRELTGLSQMFFATHCGVNSGTYQNIELGRQALSWDMARRISAATGVALESDKTGCPVISLKTLSGIPFSHEYFVAWDKWLHSDLPSDSQFADAMGKVIKLIVELAGKRDTYGMTILKVVDALRDTCTEAGMMGDLANALIERGDFPKQMLDGREVTGKTKSLVFETIWEELLRAAHAPTGKAP
jgi:transcriptional regulator with XRE-family HTH domain